MEFLFSRLHTVTPSAPPLQTEDGLFVSVPNSLEIVDGEPAGWYFTSKEHELKRKHGYKMDDLPGLKRAFGKPSASSNSEDLVLCSGIVSTFTTHSIGGHIVKYMNAKETAAFLDDLGRQGTGVLQKFVGCRGPHSHSYKSLWAKGGARVTRATNRSLPSPGMSSPELRLGTFDTPDSFDVVQEKLPSDSYIANAIQHLTFLVIQRLQFVAAEKLDPLPEADPSKLAVQSAPGSSPTASLSVLLRSKVEEVELEFALGADGHVSLRFGRVSPVSVSHIASLSATFSPAPSLLPVVPEASRPAGKPDYKKGSAMSARSARSWAMISAAGDASAASANTTAPLRRVSDATSGVKPTPPARGPPVGPKRLSGKLLPSP